MHREDHLRRIAARQHSVFTRTQALGAGFGPRTIDGYLARRHWVPIHRGVFIEAAVRQSWRQRVMAACLACGPAAVASFESAAAVWGLIDDVALPHVTVVRTARRRPGIVVHRSGRIDRASHDGFKVTHPMRTLLDLAGRWNEERLETALDDAHRRGLVSIERAARFLRESFAVSKPGAGVLRAILALRVGDRPIESELETLLFGAIRQAGLPLPGPQHVVRTSSGRRRIDFAYPDDRIAIEVDGYGVHGGRAAFEGDRVRQNELVVLGWTVLRFTWRQLRDDPIGVAYTIGRALGLVPCRWRQHQTSGRSS